jgi:hypothetical protein
MRGLLILALLAISLLLFCMTVPSMAAPSASSPALLQWRARDDGFRGWEHRGTVTTSEGALRLAQPALPCSSSVYCGEALSPIAEGLTLQEAIASWNADTLRDTWMDIQLRVRVRGQWSRWYPIATWTSFSDGSVRRQSYPAPTDGPATVVVDTLVMRRDQADAVQMMVRLLSNRPDQSPIVTAAAVAVSFHPSSSPILSTGDPAFWGRQLSIPPCSQMVYPDGGEIWCSPTSVAMVLGYWKQQSGLLAGSCEQRVRHAVDGVYDYVYRGHGNWQFNVAYAATQGLEGYVARFRGLDEAEQWIARGVPLVVSFAWDNRNRVELQGAPLTYSNGHLAVLAGFDSTGNPVVYDPAASSDAAVRRTYRRDQFERQWLSRSGGTVYVLAPRERFDLTYRHYVPVVVR